MSLRGPEVDNPPPEENLQLVELVQDLFRHYLHRRGVQWCPNHSHPSSANEKLCMSLRMLCDDFLENFGDALDRTLRTLNHPNAFGEAQLVSVLEDMFVEGVAWSRIVTSFVFAAKFAYRYHNRSSGNRECIAETAGWFTSFMGRCVVPWVRAQRGWAGLLQFREQRENIDVVRLELPSAEGVMQKTARVILGVIAIGAFFLMR